MTRPRWERLATRPCAPSQPPPAPWRTVLDNDATARTLARIITELECGCWIVALPGGDVKVPCGAHDWLEDT